MSSVLSGSRSCSPFCRADQPARRTVACLLRLPVGGGRGTERENNRPAPSGRSWVNRDARWCLCTREPMLVSVLIDFHKEMSA